RNALAVQGRSVPDMKKKPTQKPTARWVFLCFFGIYEFSIGDRSPQVSNLNSIHKTIVDVLGERYRRIYS
ncbi:MAG: IS1634 family transposase, partial [Symbiopectobacterium sp.]